MNNNNLTQSFNELSIELTYKCTLRCIYCSSDADIGANTEIDLSRLKQIITEVKNKFGVNIISLSGGETLLYSRFLDLFEFLASEGFNILIYTSGIKINPDGTKIPIPSEVLQRIYINENNPKVILNVQGHNRQLIERINNVSGSFEMIEETMHNISITGMPLGANIVPFKLNYKWLPDIVEYCRNKSFTEINFLRFVPQGRGANYNYFNTRSEVAEINQSIESILQNNNINKNPIDIRVGHPINFLFLTGNEKLYLKENSHYCRGGIDAPLILPNGDVSMCPAWKNLKEFSAGNIYEQDFADIWESYYFKIFRDFIKLKYRELKEPCCNCIHLDICRGKCVAQRILTQKNLGNNAPLEKLIYFAPDPQCFKGLIKN